MQKLIVYLTILLLSCLLILIGCATTSLKKTKVDYQQKILELKTILEKNPNDYHSLQELGIICYELGHYPTASKYLIKSFKKDPQDPKTLTYLGMSLEAENKNKLALTVYKRYKKISKLSSYRKTMEMRYNLVKRNLIRVEMRELLAQEQNLTIENLSPNSVTIFPLIYLGKRPEFASLGKGLSEMIITDLSQVKGLKVIERIRLQALLEEMALGQSGMVNENTAPRLGKLLGAAKIVHGTFDVLDENNLQLDIAFWDVRNNHFPDFTRQGDDLTNLFLLEKDLVFDLIDNMGVELTPLERDKIQHIPTKNIQAFMAYCIGLNYEDTEKFDQAAKYYQLALNIDPLFDRAGQKLKQSELFLTAEAGEEKVPAKEDLENKPKKRLVRNRLTHLGNTVGANFIPGNDSREPAENANNSGVNVFDDLPLPLPPPK